MNKLFALTAFLVAFSLACTVQLVTPTVGASPAPSVLPTVPVVLAGVTYSPTPRAAVVSALVTVYLRPTANTSGAPLAVLYNGDVVQVSACVGSWARVLPGADHPGGWVYAKYLSEVCK